MKPVELNLTDEEKQRQNTDPVTCLGIDFESDEARRAHFTEELRNKLQDPEFRKIEGFPIGEDEDILKLSDPPYYTACPNPWIADFIAEWESQKPEKPADYHYHREPFAADVSEGKNDPIYKAHSYHTKVPHKAIMRYILHYTEPGDIVFDGFCGTGMTGVAAQMCGDKATVESLGYRVDENGVVYERQAPNLPDTQEEENENSEELTDESIEEHDRNESYENEDWKPISKIGVRKAVLNDLSTIAMFIAHNYSSAYKYPCFVDEFQGFIKSLESKWNWMYKTLHPESKADGLINYVVWSDVFSCPVCSAELVFYDIAYDLEEGKVSSNFHCHSCDTLLNKNSVSRVSEIYFDVILREPVSRNKQVPVLINYTVDGKRYEKAPDSCDIELLKKVDDVLSKKGIKPIPMMHQGGEKWGAIWRSGYHYGITHAHQFYTSRNLLILNDAWNLAPSKVIQWAISGILNYVNKKQSYSGGGGGMPGVLYIASLVQEKNFIDVLSRKLKSLMKVIPVLSNFKKGNLCSTQSTSGLSKAIEDCSIDYIFIDPPFGANIMYSEGSFLWESQLNLWTNQEPEAIKSTHQKKDIEDYRQLMTLCFCELHRILKPGGWITVEFSNTKSSVWNSIQTALADTGFVVANVSALDKQQGGFKAVTTPTAVKQDLVISAYKPNGGFEERFEREAQTEEGVWDFVETHLRYLPVTKMQETGLVSIPERDPRILYDQVVAYYVRKGYYLPIDSQDFQHGLAQNFYERDGMYFLDTQAAQYDRMKERLGDTGVLQWSLFVFDEASAVEWLRGLLRNKPQSSQDINPQFLLKIQGWKKSEIDLELAILLEQNFLIYDGEGNVPCQIHSYLSSNWETMRNLPKDDPLLVAKATGRWYVPDPNKAYDLEKLREKTLLREFENYKKQDRKLKKFRTEAIRAGFKKAWHENEYGLIVSVAEKIPHQVLEEDPKLLMWYDQAITRLERGE